MMNKRISIVIITFLLLLDIAYAYSGSVAALNMTANSANASENAKSDIVNTSSFIQISKHMYEVCSKVYVNVKNDILYFTAGVTGANASIKKVHAIMQFNDKLTEYAFTGTNIVSADMKYSYVYNADRFNSGGGGFNALMFFVLTVFMLFLNALYKGSVPASHIIINNKKTLCL